MILENDFLRVNASYFVDTSPSNVRKNVTSDTQFKDPNKIIKQYFLYHNLLFKNFCVIIVMDTLKCLVFIFVVKCFDFVMTFSYTKLVTIGH